MEDYRTVRGTATGEYEEKKSRFIAQLSFADSEGAAAPRGTMFTPTAFGRATESAIPMTASRPRLPVRPRWRCCSIVA